MLPKLIKKSEPAKRVRDPELRVEDLPKLTEIPSSSWGLLEHECIFVAGFTAELDAYLLHVISAGGGVRCPVLTERVNKAVLGPSTDPR